MTLDESKENEREDIGCLEAIEMFYEYIDGELGDADSIGEFEHHLQHCRSCFSRVEFEGLLTEKLKAIAVESASEGLRRRMKLLMDNF